MQQPRELSISECRILTACDEVDKKPWIRRDEKELLKAHLGIVVQINAAATKRVGWAGASQPLHSVCCGMTLVVLLPWSIDIVQELKAMSAAKHHQMNRCASVPGPPTLLEPQGC